MRASGYSLGGAAVLWSQYPATVQTPICETVSIISAIEPFNESSGPDPRSSNY